MTVLITQPAKFLRDELSKGHAPKPIRRDVAEFTGDSSEITFAIQAGWKPFGVYVNGARFRKGASEDYTVTFDGFIYRVVMDSAPGAVNIDIDIEVAS
jgi:hypothetical protein